MALLKKIKEKLGFGSDSSDDESGETTVTVERDADGNEPNDGSGTTDEGETTDESEVAGAETGEPVVDEGDTSEDDEETEDGLGEDETDTAGSDDADAAGSADEEAVEDEETIEDDEGSEADSDDAAETAADSSAEEPDGDPVDRIKGIGPAYGERLAKIGIDTVEDLAAADPADVAEGASIGEKRAAKWVDRAKEF